MDDPMLRQGGKNVPCEVPGVTRTEDAGFVDVEIRGRLVYDAGHAGGCS